jgi:hypothetical protein
MALRAAAHALLPVLWLRRARTLVLGCLREAIIERIIQRIELVVSCAGRRLLCTLDAGIGARGARTLVLGCLLEAIIERVI